MRVAKSALIGSMALVLAAPAGAQGLANLIPNLFDKRIELRDPPPGFPSHAAHFVDESNRLRLSGLSINEALVSQLATFPLGSSAGGFTYTFDSALGVFNRSTESFGPVYAERAQTLGRGKWNAGFSLQTADYDAVGGIDLTNGELAFPLSHQDVNNDGSTADLFFEGDVILARSRIEASTDTAVVFATYGVSDRFDLGVAVPLVSVDLKAEAVLDIQRFSTSGSPTIHRFPDGSSSQTFTARGDASGIGDVVVRGKYRLWEEAGSGLAVALDLRLPTGDEEDLLGTGATQSKLFFVASTTWGSFAPHLNVGYTVSSGGSDFAKDLPDEFNYAAGFDLALHPRFTVAIDAIGRVLQDATRIESAERELRFRPAPGAAVQTATLPDLEIREDDLNLLLGSLGLRWNPVGNLLFTANALFSLSDDGLEDEDVIPLFGLDYSF